jgi:tricorn protease
MTSGFRGLRRTMAVVCLAGSAALAMPALANYFRMPAIAGDTVVFVSEGDIWRAPAGGGQASRLTTHQDAESFPALSPDRQWLAFVGRYEGPAEVYVMPFTGGTPKRLTHDGGTSARVQGWTPDGKILYSSTRYSGKPGTRLYTLDPKSGERGTLPLAEAAEGCYLGSDLIFTRRSVLSDNVKAYTGGRAQNLWKFDGKSEAVPLTADFNGTSRQPMCWQGRVYFLSDRDGTMNLWSMNAAGKDAKQHTLHAGWDIRSASMDNGNVVYQLGADLRVFATQNNQDRQLNVTLNGDFDQARSRWVKNPWDYVTSLSLSPTGDRVAITARGQIFVAPVGVGRRVEVTRSSTTRAREARFMPDGKSVLAYSDASGEFELTRFPANGIGETRQLTSGATVLRQGFSVSPDGKWVVNADKDQNLYLLNIATGENKKLDQSMQFGFSDFEWSPDSKWLTYATGAENQFDQIWLVEIATAKKTVLTSDRYHARSAAFSPDGKWLWFLSARTMTPVVGSPWGQRNMGTAFDRQVKIYALALAKDAQWPFQPKDELQKAEPEKKPDVPPTPGTPATPQTPGTPAAATPAKDAKDAPKADAAKTDPAKPAAAPTPATTKPIVIDFAGLTTRLYEVPVPAGNYSELATDGKRLYYINSEPAPAGPQPRRTLRTVAIESQGPTPVTVETYIDDVRSYELSLDRKKVLVRKANDIWVADAGAKAPPDLSKSVVNLRDFTFDLDPREEWRQMFVDVWRMHRDYFYDKNMHGVDWKAMRAKYEPLVARVNDRAELNDVVSQLTSEVSLLHSQVFTADLRKGTDEIDIASLAADLTKVADGWRVDKLFSGDPELPDEIGPLAQPANAVKAGEIITHINGVSLAKSNPGDLLRNQVGKQVLLGVKDAAGKARQIIVTPISALRDVQLRYLTWEWERKARVEEKSKGRFGYLHLQAMGPNDLGRWAREFYPVFQREGLIIDLRNNNGGSIDSMLIEKLLRRAWAWWKPRSSPRTFSNQQNVFRGHVVAIINEDTYSDGETMAEGLKRLGIATLVGMRTSGAGVWLSDQNRLVDNGLARSAELGQFVPGEGWIVEGKGVAPDIVVDNLPFATNKGEDAQLDAAIKVLEEKLAKQPVPKIEVPAYPKMKR